MLITTMARKISDYQGMTALEHPLAKPGMYIGSIRPYERQDWVYKDDKMSIQKISLSEGIIRLFLEILSNASDNADTSRKMKVNAGSIAVRMDKHRITIRNTGVPIPILVKPEFSTKDRCFTVVDYIFSVPLTGSNYDVKQDRTGAGTNGLGAKLTGIFSDEFTVKVGDAVNGHEQITTWTRNLQNHASTVIRPGYVFGKNGWTALRDDPYKGENYVEVSWVLDFKRFELECYPLEAYLIFSRYLIDTALSAEISTSFNGQKFQVKSLRDYAKLFFDEETVKSSILHSEESFDLCILDTPDAPKVISFVNGLMTLEGGIHVKTTYAAITGVILQTLALEKKAEKQTLSMTDIKAHVSIILVCRLKNPEYTSQTKTKLTHPNIKITFAVDLFKKIPKWKLANRLYKEIEAKNLRLLTKSDSGKRKKQFIESTGEDANDAGSDSRSCVLSIVEGISAAAYTKKRNELVKGGKDKNGYCPIRGKFLNVTPGCATIEQLAENTEIQEIKKHLGLREGVNYNDDISRKELRYGFILCISDADADGSHIKTLLLNYFHRRYPSIIELGMFGYLVTPVVRCFDSRGAIRHRFTTEDDYTAWCRDNPNHGLRVVYYKGLARSKDADIRDDVDSANMIICVYDEKSSESMDLAFHPKMADERKEWIRRWRSVTKVNDIIAVPSSAFYKRKITDLINTDLVDYTVTALFRAIPAEKDGLKKSQRQALYFALDYWNYGNNAKDVINIARFAAMAAVLTHYHHGEGSMEETIIKMGQSFIGSNNLQYFTQDGQFGTRDELGKDAGAARYLAAKTEWWIPYVYSKELVDLVEKRVVEGEEAEPIWLPCDIPMHVINGSRGVATGHSTYIPPHHPLHVVEWLITRCSGREPPPILPWFRSFTGQVTCTDTVQTFGRFEIVKKYNDKCDLIVSEVPIGQSLKKYLGWLQSLRKDKKIVSIRNESGSETPLYKITAWEGECDYKSLHLCKSYSMTNMTLIDDMGFPSVYTDSQQILQLYYDNMIDMYAKVIKHRIQVARNKIIELTERIRFIQLVAVEKKIIIYEKTSSDIQAQMQLYSIDVKYYTKTMLADCSVDKIKELQRRLDLERDEIIQLAELTAQGLWAQKLQALHSELRKRY